MVEELLRFFVFAFDLELTPRSGSGRGAPDLRCSLLSNKDIPILENRQIGEDNSEGGIYLATPAMTRPAPAAAIGAKPELAPTAVLPPLAEATAFPA